MKKLNFIIIDGYPKPSRDQFDSVGMTKAGELYAKLLAYSTCLMRIMIFIIQVIPDVVLPNAEGILKYDGVLMAGLQSYSLS